MNNQVIVATQFEQLETLNVSLITTYTPGKVALTNVIFVSATYAESVFVIATRVAYLTK